jgi:hypothetical protein
MLVVGVAEAICLLVEVAVEGAVAVRSIVAVEEACIEGIHNKVRPF